jgi:diguanylate cyclase (GGDEF)-like protein
MNLTGTHRPSSFGFNLVRHPPLSRTWALLVLAIAFALIFWLDLATGSAPVHHLYYLPIIFAAVRFRARGAFFAVLAAVVCYHVANRDFLTWHYQESDILRIVIFIAVAVIVERQTAYVRHLHELATTDDLTGLDNLRAFEARLEQMFHAARQHRRPLALIALDLDRLKSLNDVHGHLAGAEAVQHVGQVLATRLPAESAACRYGGDEFVIALPRCGEAEAAEIAEDLRGAVHALAPVLAGIEFPVGTLSISVGIACWSAERAPADQTFDAQTTGRALFHAADAALYAAKRDGRNCIRTDTARRTEPVSASDPARG